MNTFVLNGNTIPAKRFDFNLLCDLDDLGVSIQDAGKKPMSFVRAYIALCANVTLESAGEMIQEHMAEHDLEEVFSVINKEMDSSDFFRNQKQKTTPKKTTKAQTIKG